MNPAILLIAGGVGLMFAARVIERQAKEEERGGRRLNGVREEMIDAMYEKLHREHPDATDDEVKELARAPGGPLDAIDKEVYG